MHLTNYSSKFQNSEKAHDSQFKPKGPQNILTLKKKEKEKSWKKNVDSHG